MSTDFRTRRVVTAAIVVLASLASHPIEAGPPTDQVKNRVDRVIKILDDPQMKPDARTADRRAALGTIANEVFDFTEISRPSLARHWQPPPPAQAEEFPLLVGELPVKSYRAQ